MALTIPAAYVNAVKKFLKEAGNVFGDLVSGKIGKDILDKIGGFISESENALKSGVLGQDLSPMITP